MATTYTLISSSILTGSQASVTFSAIPSTYTDLCLKISDRQDSAGVSNYTNVTFNSDSGANYSRVYLAGSGSAASSNLSSGLAFFRYLSDGSSATSNTFASNEIYIPSYTVSQYKPLSIFSVTETNAAATDMQANAALWRTTAAITSIQLTPSSGNFVSGSSFYLYGIKNS